MTNNDTGTAERPIITLGNFVRTATIAYRKGAEYEEKDIGAIKVITVNGYPETPSRGVLVDVHFLMIGFTEAAAISKADFLAMCDAAASGEYADVTPEILDRGPSYITLGAWLGSQDIALRFLALGSHLGAWEVITPKRLGVKDGPTADELAGSGYVMSGGVRR